MSSPNITRDSASIDNTTVCSTNGAIAEKEKTKKKKKSKHRSLKSASMMIITSNQFFNVEKRTLNFSNGDKYSGDFDLTHARYHGKGMFRWATGASYEGDWWKGKRTGKGTLKSSDGSTYIGDWLHNKRHGMGELRRFDGAIYVGPWVDDKMSGDGGIFTYCNGDKYVGKWLNGFKEGRGEYVYNTDRHDLKKRAKNGLNVHQDDGSEGSRFKMIVERGYLHRKISLVEASANSIAAVTATAMKSLHANQSNSEESNDVGFSDFGSENSIERGGDLRKRQSLTGSELSLGSPGGLSMLGETFEEHNLETLDGAAMTGDAIGTANLECSESPLPRDEGSVPIDLPPPNVEAASKQKLPFLVNNGSKDSNSLPSSSSSTSTSSVTTPAYVVKYRGVFHEGLSSGEGESTNSMGDRYFGAWDRGAREGRGAYRWLGDGKTLRSDWKGGVAEGHGILTRPKPDVPDNEEDEEESEINLETEDGGNKIVEDPAERAKKKDKGPSVTYTVLLPGENRKQALQQAANGQEVVMYEGQFKKGLFHGMGTEYEHDRSGQLLDATYEGPFHKGLRDSYGDTVAFGRRAESDGSLYVGWYSEDKAHGAHGDHYDADSGSRYIGSWWKGNRQGTGKRWSADGGTYEGNWLQDKPHGRGKACFANGDEYLGEYLRGARHGPGIYSRQDGVDQYIGFWAHGAAKGRGYRCYANGAFYIGDMESNLPHGEGVMRMGDGASWYYGGWKCGKRHGGGVELFGGSGTRFEGVWRDGVKDNSFDDHQLLTQSGSAIAQKCEGLWLVRPSVVESGHGDNDYYEDDLDEFGNLSFTSHGVDSVSLNSAQSEESRARVKNKSYGASSRAIGTGSYGKSFQEGSVSSTVGSVRSMQVVTYPALYFDPDIHKRIMVQKWIRGVLQFEYPDIAAVMRPRLPGEEGYVGNEDATNYLLTKAKPSITGSDSTLHEEEAPIKLPRAYSSTRRRIAGTKAPGAKVLPRNLMPSQGRAPVACSPLVCAETSEEALRRHQDASVKKSARFVASNEDFEDRRRVLENSIYDPGQCMILLVDDEILSVGVLATPDSASEVRAKVRAEEEAKENRAKHTKKNRHRDYEGVGSVRNEESSEETRRDRQEEDKEKNNKSIKNQHRKWVEAVVVRFVGEPGRHQISICMGTPLNPTSTTLEGLIVPLTTCNHFSFPILTSRPPLRTKHLPAPELDLNERRIELNMVKELLACKPSEFSDEQREVSMFVERKAAQVVQDALDAAEQTRQDNLDRKKEALADAEKLKQHLPGLEEE